MSNTQHATKLVIHDRVHNSLVLDKSRRGWSVDLGENCGSDELLL